MRNDFYKFPSTPHLALLGDVEIRSDKVMTESERAGFLQHELVIEEKVDGANLGISFDTRGNLRVQNRGSYLHLPYQGEWKKLSNWLNYRSESFFDILLDRYILFGEWCYAQHSISYDSLPDWLLGFDVFDKRNRRFLSISRRNAMFSDLSIVKVPFIAKGKFTLQEIEGLLSKSQLGDHPAEGLYLRFDRGDWLEQRAKLVRPRFIQGIVAHWSRSGIKANQLSHQTWA